MRYFIFPFVILSLFWNQKSFSQIDIQWPGGRYAMSCDGNQHDPDDIGATPFAMAMMYYAGLSDKVVHLDHSNHLGDNNEAMMRMMIESCEGAVTHFDINPEIVFNNQQELEASIENFTKQALKSTVTDPLWFVCAGPMEVPYRMLEAVKKADKSKLQYINCISHSKWNNWHEDTDYMNRRWVHMKEDFPEVIFHELPDQNNTREDDDFNTPRQHWEWLKRRDEKTAWLHERDQFYENNPTGHEPKFDVSDAGMTYWLLTGGPGKGHEKAGWQHCKYLFQEKVEKKPGTIEVLSKELPLDGKFYIDYFTGVPILAIKPDEVNFIPALATTWFEFEGKNQVYDIEFHGIGENDGEAEFKVFVNNQLKMEYTIPLSEDPWEVGQKFNKTAKNVVLKPGDKIKIEGATASADGKEWSRARWLKIVFTPLD